MSNKAISIRGLSKAYTISHAERHITLAEQLQHLRVISQTVGRVARRIGITQLAYHLASPRCKIVRRKLVRREHPEATIDEVLGELARMGYLDDARFAKTKALAAAEADSPAMKSYVEGQVKKFIE